MYWQVWTSGGLNNNEDAVLLRFEGMEMSLKWCIIGRVMLPYLATGVSAAMETKWDLVSMAA